VGVLLGALASCHYGSNYSLPTIDVPNSIAIADVDGDGTPDLLVATTADQGNPHNPGFANVILGNHGSPVRSTPACSTRRREATPPAWRSRTSPVPDPGTS